MQLPVSPKQVSSATPLPAMALKVESGARTLRAWIIALVSPIRDGQGFPGPFSVSGLELCGCWGRAAGALGHP